jgi:hypothetical protein
VLRTYVRRHKRMQALQAADSALGEHDETLQQSILTLVAADPNLSRRSG